MVANWSTVERNVRRCHPAANRKTCGISDDHLAAQCRWDAFPAAGLGGQKRNKTSAVRVTDVPTGICATAAESRSQQQNRRAAFGALATDPAASHARPSANTGIAGLVSRIDRAPADCSPFGCHERYLVMMGLVLDVLTESGGLVSASAQWLEISTANLVRFLQNDVDLLAAVNQLRQARGLRALGGA